MTSGVDLLQKLSTHHSASPSNARLLHMVSYQSPNLNYFPEAPKILNESTFQILSVCPDSAFHSGSQSHQANSSLLAMLSTAKCIGFFPSLQLQNSSAFPPFSGKRLSFVVHQSFFQDCLSPHCDILLKILSAWMSYCLKAMKRTCCCLQGQLQQFRTSFFSFFIFCLHFFRPYFLQGCLFFQSFWVNLAQG